MAKEIKIGDKVKLYELKDKKSGFIGEVIAVNVMEAPNAVCKVLPAMYKFDEPRCAIVIESFFEDGGTKYHNRIGAVFYPKMNDDHLEVINGQ